MRRTTLLLIAVVLIAACSSGSGSTSASSPPKTVTTAAGAADFPFDATSAKQFPGVSLERRLQMAQQVCDSIRSHGDDYVAWLKLTTTRNDLVPFVAPQPTLAAFSGLAVTAVCPGYVSQLQSALSGLVVTSSPSS